VRGIQSQRTIKDGVEARSRAEFDVWPAIDRNKDKTREQSRTATCQDTGAEGAAGAGGNCSNEASICP